ncbi:sodium-dependent proline transporter-like [Haliotis rufescens]|uniref:sodium-dependent proline transporter-like n=1 Tax=Haliotis rufescens TaxID=6454 RepID=UPI00201F272B|nr:sodium-dependent proline transporter-like [Haliotis rufescens]
MSSMEDGDAGAPMAELHCQVENGSEPTRQRESWSRHLDYMLTMVGYCVALGNLLRFPYICNRNGGGAFMIPFILVLVITGFPAFFLESTISQFSGKGAKQVWSFCPMFKGIGVGSVLFTCAYMPYYNLYLAWPIYYMVKSCSSVLPWTTCGNSWNTDLCIDNVNTTYRSNETVLGENNSATITKSEKWENVTLAHTPAEEFWKYNVLDVSTGMEDAVYVTALLPYILLVAIFITTLLQPGALYGLHYYVIPDFNKLLDIQVWIEACLQVFYSLGPGFGMIGTAASYKNFNEPCLRDSLILTLVSEGTSIFSGLVTFATLGVMSQKTGVPIETVVSNGPGLGFIIYPDALAQFPLPQLWSFLFFLMLLMVGLDSQGGPYMFQLVDWYIVSLGPLVICTLECVVVSWIYGIRRISRDVEMMIGKPLSMPIKILWAFVTPAILIITFILTLLRYQPPTYGKYEFPSYASTIGWFLAVLPLLPIPVYMVIAVRKHMATNSLKKVTDTYS